MKSAGSVLEHLRFSLFQFSFLFFCRLSTLFILLRRLLPTVLRLLRRLRLYLLLPADIGLDQLTKYLMPAVSRVADTKCGYCLPMLPVRCPA